MKKSNTNNMLVTVGVIFGGRSVEHEVSVISGIQAIQNLDKSQYNAVPIYISKEGIWYTGDALLNIENYKQLDTLKASSSEVFMTPHFDDLVLYFKKSTATQNIDVILTALHGGTGEGGAIQGFFELKGIPFTGCSSLSSAICMDKICTKRLLESHNLPYVPYAYFFDFEWYSDRESILTQIETKLSYPLIVKPADLGSSVGVTKATSKTELVEAIEVALPYTDRVLVEKAVDPLMEINCSVVGDSESAKSSILEEPLMTGATLSYADKYISGGKGGKTGKIGSTTGKASTEVSGMGMSASQKRRIPAEISETLTTQIKESALATFQLMQCSGVVRIDYLVDANNDTFYINEINTIPGSLSFYLWEPSGLPFPDLLGELIQIALKRRREEEKHISSYTDFNLFSLSSFSGKK